MTTTSPRPTREERIAALEAELARARSVVDDAAGAFEELRGPRHRRVVGRHGRGCSTRQKAPGRDQRRRRRAAGPGFCRDDKAGALAERVLDEMRAIRARRDGRPDAVGRPRAEFSPREGRRRSKEPDGQFRVGAGKAAVLEFLRDLPWRAASLRRFSRRWRSLTDTRARCRKVGGIGRVLEMKLADALNVRTCGDLIDNLPECYCVLGKSAAMGFLHEVALGCGECGGPTDDGEEDDERVIRRKGLGNERTFRPVRGVAALTEKLVRIAGLVSERLVKHDMRAAKWTLKLKTSDFRITTRDTATKKTGKDKYVRSVKSIVKLLKPLLLEAIGEAEAAGTPLEIRLMGVRSSDFEGQYVPLARGQTTLKDVKMKPASPPRPQPAKPPRRRRQVQVSPGSAATSAGIDGADVDPATLSELPPAVRADIERQLALWRKSRRSAPARRPPPKKPRTLDAFLAAPAPAPAAPPPTQVDEPAVAQITSMGFSRKRALEASSRPTATCHGRSRGSCREC